MMPFNSRPTLRHSAYRPPPSHTQAIILHAPGVSTSVLTWMPHSHRYTKSVYIQHRVFCRYGPPISLAGVNDNTQSHIWLWWYTPSSDTVMLSCVSTDSGGSCGCGTIQSAAIDVKVNSSLLSRNGYWFSVMCASYLREEPVEESW